MGIKSKISVLQMTRSIVKRQPTEWEKILANQISDKEISVP